MPASMQPPDSPYDEDGYCKACGHGFWRVHAFTCEWVDMVDVITSLRWRP